MAYLFNIIKLSALRQDNPPKFVYGQSPSDEEEKRRHKAFKNQTAFLEGKHDVVKIQFISKSEITDEEPKKKKIIIIII